MNNVVEICCSVDSVRDHYTHYVYWKQLPRDVINYLISKFNIDIDRLKREIIWNDSVKVHYTYILCYGEDIQEALDLFGIEYNIVGIHEFKYSFGDVYSHAAHRYKDFWQYYDLVTEWK